MWRMVDWSKLLGRASDYLRDAYNGMNAERKTSGHASSMFAPSTNKRLDAGRSELERPSFGVETFHALSVASSPILGEFAAAGGCLQLEKPIPRLLTRPGGERYDTRRALRPAMDVRPLLAQRRAPPAPNQHLWRAFGAVALL